MSTTKLNQIITDVARLLKHPITLATDDTDLTGNASPYTSTLLTRYVNNAVRDLLLENYRSYGDRAFMELFPEYVKTSGVLTLAAGVVQKPTDAFLVLNMKLSDNSVFFTRIKQSVVEDIRSGKEKLIVPSATSPVFWDEAGSIYTLGLLAGDVVMRYIVTHQDILPITVVASHGNWLTGANGAYTAATRLLAGTMNSNFAAADKNKFVMFRTATDTYCGRIESRVSNSSVVVIGDNLPAGNIVAGSVLAIIVSDVEPDSSDLKINQYWHKEIIKRAVDAAMQDAKNNIVL